MKKLTSVMLVSVACTLAACSGSVESADVNPTPAGMRDGPGLLSGDSGNILDAFRSKGGKFEFGEGGGSSLAVNGFLWRAALETISFLPLESADSAGGVIITDWAVRPDDTNERVKATVYLFGKTLSPTNLQVKLFKQRKRDGQWVEVPTNEATTRQLEDAILTKARQLKVQSAQPR